MARSDAALPWLRWWVVRIGGVVCGATCSVLAAPAVRRKHEVNFKVISSRWRPTDFELADHLHTAAFGCSPKRTTWRHSVLRAATARAKWASGGGGLYSTSWATGIWNRRKQNAQAGPKINGPKRSSTRKCDFVRKMAQTELKMHQSIDLGERSPFRDFQPTTQIFARHFWASARQNL